MTLVSAVSAGISSGNTEFLYTPLPPPSPAFFEKVEDSEVSVKNKIDFQFSPKSMVSFQENRNNNTNKEHHFWKDIK